MFWGLIMEPNKRYTQVVEKPFHISQAAMDTSTGDNEPCQVMVVVDGKNFLVCTLQKNKSIQVPLDLYFKTGNSIAFLTNGKCNVHLTGYLDPDYEEEASDEEEGDTEDEEVPDLVPIKNKRKLEESNDATETKKAKQDKKTAKKKTAAESSDDEDDDEEDDQLQKLLDGEDVETDENDESYKLNTSGEASDEEEDDSAEEEEEEDEDDDEDDNEAEASEDAETTLDTSKEETKIDMSKLTKSQKKRLKKKQKQEKNKDEPKVNGVEKGKKAKPEPQQKADKKKPKEEGKKEAQDGQVADKKEKKSLSGGVQIEDLKVGSGPVAKPGKVVMVYYEGRLKQNNKMFDNCIKGPGFKFRLGAKEVISGWDIGVSGMKVGGKRKIICPPAMAYGAKGSPPVIPPNSTLIFEVELKNVK